MHLFRILSLLLLLLSSILSPSALFAAEGNNPFGIHISDINEVNKANELVNSQGGEWGYVALIIHSNDRKIDKWQERMNVLNDKKLIPIVRIATYANGDSWTKPVADDAHDWAVFLSSLYWPTKQRIVTVYNEPNHATEWGNETNPKEYAEVLNATIDALKRESSDFVVLNAGFDASSPQEPPRYMDQVRFMDEMEKTVPGIFSKLDGWASHSYPNPGFSGSVNDTGRGSIQTYKWELELLRSRFGVTKNLPVYITETGWVTKNSDHPKLRYSESDVASFTKQAFEKVWLPDTRVRAVTPFMLTYKQPLFSHFAWLRSDDSETEVFSAIKGIAKTKAIPDQAYRSVITTVTVPSLIQRDLKVDGTVAVKNTGNAIWYADNGLSFVQDDPDKFIVDDNFRLEGDTKILPGQSHIFRFTMFSSDTTRRTSIGLQMKNGSEVFGEKLFVPVRVFHPPNLKIVVVNPTQKDLEGAEIVFRNRAETDIVRNVTLRANGSVGNYTSTLFVPGEVLTVTVQTPFRDMVTTQIRIEEGENLYSFVLPEEIPFWMRIFRR